MSISSNNETRMVEFFYFDCRWIHKNLSRIISTTIQGISLINNSYIKYSLIHNFTKKTYLFPSYLKDLLQPNLALQISVNSENSTKQIQIRRTGIMTKGIKYCHINYRLCCGHSWMSSDRVLFFELSITESITYTNNRGPFWDPPTVLDGDMVRWFVLK